MTYFCFALFAFGLAIASTKKNLIMVLLGIELMLNAANLNFIYFSQFYPDAEGQVMGIAVMLVAAAEAAVALAIIIQLKRKYGTTNPDKMNELKY